jgi:hypothetical protein
MQMVREENDPDTLQLLDELNLDWAQRWHKITNKNKSPKTELSLILIPTEEEKQVRIKL